MQAKVHDLTSLSGLTRQFLWSSLLLYSLLLAACTSSAPSSTSSTPDTSHPIIQIYAGAVNKPVATTGCGHTSPFPLGVSTNVTIAASPAVSEGYARRTYIVHVPASYSTSHPQAVILAFHGYSGTAAGMDHSSGFSPLADQQDVIAVYPQGLPEGVGGKPFWASVGPIDYGIDDALFVSNVLDDLQKKLCVDAQRIFVTGFSNGGGMSGFLACRMAMRIAAFAPVSGNFYALPSGCKPGRPVAILDFHGTKDPLLPYDGIPASLNPAWPLPAIMQWLQDWATRNGCKTGPITFLHISQVTGLQWSNCQNNAVVVHYRIEGGGHSSPPPINGHSVASVMWQFFQAHPLP